MGKNNFFQFKKFRLIQEKAAMKVGIDGVLLGAWADIDGAKHVLDIGTGTGLIALMSAQRSGTLVDAVELEPEAAAEALNNFRNSEWKVRISMTLCAFQEFATDKKYDHIISNPPFFENSPKSKDTKRTQARHSDTLSLSELIGNALKLLAGNGKISLILTADKEEWLRSLAKENELYINRFSPVSPDETRRPHRILAELSLCSGREDVYPIILRESETGNYTQQYRELTKEFYLAF